jgi:hypothetical protein
MEGTVLSVHSDMKNSIYTSAWKALKAHISPLDLEGEIQAGGEMEHLEPGPPQGRNRWVRGRYSRLD